MATLLEHCHAAT